MNITQIKAQVNKMIGDSNLLNEATIILNDSYAYRQKKLDGLLATYKKLNNCPRLKDAIYAKISNLEYADKLAMIDAMKLMIKARKNGG